MNQRSAVSGKPEPKATEDTSAKSSASTKTVPASGSAAYRNWSINTGKKSTPLPEKYFSESTDFSKWTESTDRYQHVRPELGKVALSTETKPSRMIAAIIPVAIYRKMQARSRLVNELAMAVLQLALRKPVNEPFMQPSRDAVCTIMLRVNNQDYEKLSEIADCHFGGNVGMATCFLFSLGAKNSAVNVSPIQGFMSPKDYIVEPVPDFVVNDPDWPTSTDIIAARTELKISQTLMAKIIGMSRKTVHCHEDGVRNVRKVRMLIMRTCMAMGYIPNLPPTTS